MTDFRDSELGRRQSWYGAKRHVKRTLSWRLPHAAMRGAIHVKPDLASPRLPAPAHMKEVAGVADGVEFVMLRPDRCEIAKELYWGGGRRPDPADALAIDLFARLAREADVILDVGAYTGIFTLVSSLANPDAEVHAFEVVPDVYQMLFANCVRNDVLYRVTLHHTGVGHDGQVVTFPATSEGSALPSFYAAGLTFNEGVRIRFGSLDHFCRSLQEAGRILMKIDVEGTEGDIFDNGRAFFAKFRPDILCEVLPDSTSPSTLLDVLAPLGYNYYLVRASGMTAEPSIVPDKEFRDWFLSTKSESELPVW